MFLINANIYCTSLRNSLYFFSVSNPVMCPWPWSLVLACPQGPILQVLGLSPGLELQVLGLGLGLGLDTHVLGLEPKYLVNFKDLC